MAVSNIDVPSERVRKTPAKTIIAARIEVQNLNISNKSSFYNRSDNLIEDIDYPGY